MESSGHSLPPGSSRRSPGGIARRCTSEIQRGRSCILHGFDVGAVLDLLYCVSISDFRRREGETTYQQLHNGEIPFLSGVDQPREVILIRRVHVGPGREQMPHGTRFVIHGDDEERGLEVLISGVQVRAGIGEHPY